MDEPDTCADMPVVYEDEWLLAIDKPAGLLSQPGRTVEDSVSARVRDARPDARGSLLVHRLDMDTSGVILLAKTAQTHANLQQQFEKRQVRKRYRARLERPLARHAGLVRLPLRLDVDRRPWQIVCMAQGRRAETVWIAQSDGSVLLLPRTGRTHQLRVHAADLRGLGNPIKGDRLYGQEADRLYLHAERLLVHHPVSGEAIVFDAPCPFG